MSISRRALMSAFAATTAVAGFAGKAAFAQASADPAVLEAMRRATRFMVEEAAVNGGYVWSYLPDFSRRWGELEASPTMIWIQPPGTATMGHLFLDAYHATGDEFYYEAAQSATGAVIAAQVSAGGWNYVHDTAGEAAEQQWYDTVAANAWRLEEFRKRYGNGTFDDAGTSESAQLLLRMYLEKRDETYRGRSTRPSTSSWTPSTRTAAGPSASRCRRTRTTTPATSPSTMTWPGRTWSS